MLPGRSCDASASFLERLGSTNAASIKKIGKIEFPDYTACLLLLRPSFLEDQNDSVELVREGEISSRTEREIMKLTSSIMAGMVAAGCLSLATFIMAQGHHTPGTLPSPVGHPPSGTPPGHHYGWDRGRHNPHHSPSPTATPTASPTATVSPTATPNVTPSATPSATPTATP
jgi:hypothetical protein